MSTEGSNERPRRGALGKPWQPGQSGNPKGRAKSLATRIDELMGPDEILNGFLGIWRGDLPGFGRKERLEALKWLSERRHGRVPEVTASVDLEAIADLDGVAALSADELRDLLRASRAPAAVTRAVALDPEDCIPPPSLGS